MGYQENGIGFTDHAVSGFNEASMPVGHSCSHHSHPQLCVVRMVYFPGKHWVILVQERSQFPNVCQWCDMFSREQTVYSVEYSIEFVARKCAAPLGARGHGLHKDTRCCEREWTTCRQCERDTWVGDLIMQPRCHQHHRYNDVPKLKRQQSSTSH